MKCLYNHCNNEFKPIIWSHQTKKYCSRVCKGLATCQRNSTGTQKSKERYKKWYAANREKVLIRMRKYREKRLLRDSQ